MANKTSDIPPSVLPLFKSRYRISWFFRPMILRKIKTLSRKGDSSHSKKITGKQTLVVTQFRKTFYTPRIQKIRVQNVGPFVCQNSILKTYKTYTCNGLISSARIFLLLTHFQIFSYHRRGGGGGIEFCV